MKPSRSPISAGLAEQGPESAERIRQVALTLFRQRGFHGTSIRDLAQGVGMEPASLYYHYASKQDILADLIDRTMDALIAGIDRAVTGADGAQARLALALRFHLGFHVEFQTEAFISHSELRALTPGNLDRIVAKRDRYEATMRALLEAGVREGCFAIDDVALLCKAILMMCSGVSDWFGPHGRLSGESITQGYVDLVMRMVSGYGAGSTA